jgi:hypothetical protein
MDQSTNEAKGERSKQTQTQTQTHTSFGRALVEVVGAVVAQHPDAAETGEDCVGIVARVHSCENQNKKKGINEMGGERI